MQAGLGARTRVHARIPSGQVGQFWLQRLADVLGKVHTAVQQNIGDRNFIAGDEISTDQQPIEPLSAGSLGTSTH